MMDNDVQDEVELKHSDGSIDEAGGVVTSATGDRKDGQVEMMK